MYRLFRGAFSYALLAFVVLCLAMPAGCGRRETAPAVETASEDMTEASAEADTVAEPVPEEVKLTTETARVGICLSRSRDRDNERLMQELQRALELRGFMPENLRVREMTRSRSRQDEQVDECLEEGCAVMIISAVSDARIPGMADRITEAGAQAVFVNCSPGDDELTRWSREQMPCVWVGTTYAQELA